jgi:predicted phosphodiesterase
MKIGILSDVHANLEALNAALAHLERERCALIYSGGDLINYGPEPWECIQRAAGTVVLQLTGNHEEEVHRYINGDKGMDWFREHAKLSIEWTVGHFKEGPGIGMLLDYLLAVRDRPVPSQHWEGRTLYVHGVPTDPLFGYLTDKNINLLDQFARMEEAEGGGQVDYCFCGHTHRPALYSFDGDYVKDESAEMRVAFEKKGNVVYTRELEPGKKYIINVGSVGQPRDGDTRGCCVIYDDRLRPSVRFIRFVYDHGKTVEKMKQLRVPAKNWQRLLTGR